MSGESVLTGVISANTDPMPPHPPTVKNSVASEPSPFAPRVVSGHVNAAVTNNIRNGNYGSLSPPNG